MSVKFIKLDCYYKNFLFLIYTSNPYFTFEIDKSKRYINFRAFLYFRMCPELHMLSLQMTGLPYKLPLLI